MKQFLAILICKMTRFLLRLLGRGGTALPGKIALKICPDLLDKLSRGVDITIVTGTNGKTTTSLMIAAMYEKAGVEVLTNPSGSNLEQGITADFISNANIFGKPISKTAVIECDEAAFRTVCGKLAPKIVVVTNVFRDQLDRYGEITHTLNKIAEGLKATPSATVILNADCSLTASLSKTLPNEVFSYGFNVDIESAKSAVSDAPRCLFCGEKYAYESRTFAHLGKFYCPACQYSRPVLNLEVNEPLLLEKDFSEARFSILGIDYDLRISLPAIYNIYNAAAALSAISVAGIDIEKASEALSDVKSGFGRMEKFDVDGTSAMLILVKNPAGADRAIDYVKDIETERLIVFMLNDNYADSTDISWIWDVAYETLVDSKVMPKFAVGGTRAMDMRLRLKYAGIDEDDIIILADDAEILAEIEKLKIPTFIMPTYTAMLQIRATLSKKCGTGEFWE